MCKTPVLRKFFKPPAMIVSGILWIAKISDNVCMPVPGCLKFPYLKAMTYVVYHNEVCFPFPFQNGLCQLRSKSTCGIDRAIKIFNAIDFSLTQVWPLLTIFA